MYPSKIIIINLWETTTHWKRKRMKELENIWKTWNEAKEQPKTE